MRYVKMKQRPNLIQLAKEVYKANKAKGFHDAPVSNNTLLMLVITELSEAIEADRKGKRADLQKYRELILNTITPSPLAFTTLFELYIKDTVEDELADTVIRVLDLAGYRNISTLTTSVLAWYQKGFYDSFCENIYYLIKAFIKSHDLGIIAPEVIRGVEDLCKQMNIDIWYHVALKLEYNKTRPQRHGKAY